MPIRLTDDFKSVSDLKKHTHEIFKQIHNTGRPMFITVNGRPDAVLMDARTFEKKLQALNLKNLLAVGEEDIVQGRIRPARQFLKELKARAKKV